MLHRRRGRAGSVLSGHDLGSVAVSRSSSALRPVSDGVARVEARATGGEIVTTCVCELEYAPKLNAMKAVVARNSAR
jgi:hypothetical protein